MLAQQHRCPNIPIKLVDLTPSHPSPRQPIVLAAITNIIGWSVPAADERNAQHDSRYYPNDYAHNDRHDKARGGFVMMEKHDRRHI